MFYSYERSVCQPQYASAYHPIRLHENLPTNSEHKNSEYYRQSSAPTTGISCRDRSRDYLNTEKTGLSFKSYRWSIVSLALYQMAYTASGIVYIVFPSGNKMGMTVEDGLARGHATVDPNVEAFYLAILLRDNLF